jgi:hypothetical protein
MSQARLFVPQQTVERWVSDGRAVLEGDELTMQGFRFHVTPAVRFTAEVSTGRDEHNFVGRVKTVGKLASLEPELTPGAAIFGENAYEVVDGYALTLRGQHAQDPYPAIVKLLAKP